MKKRLNVGFLTTKSGRWPDELPTQRLKEYGQWTQKELAQCNVIIYDSIVSDRETADKAVVGFKQEMVDIVIMVYGAFTGDDIPCQLADELKVPIILWAPREPEFERDERLIANALVAVTMNGASLNRLEKPYHVLYGNKEDELIAGELKKLIKVYDVINRLNGTLFGLFGYRPTAFYNSAFDEGLIRRTFGVRFEETDLKMIFDRMETVSEEEVKADMAGIIEKHDTALVPEGYLETHCKLYLALKEIIKEQGYNFAGLKCWPEMGALKATPCGVIGRLADDGISVICESDVDAGLAAIIQNYFTGQPTFITDMINIDEEKNTLVFWHCGNAAISLMDEKDDITAANHPLAGAGVAFYGALRHGDVTISRLCNIGGKYKLFLMKGEALSTHRNTKGVMTEVRVESPVREVLNTIFTEGVPHHYSIVWQDITEEMTLLAKQLNVEIISL